MLAEVPCLMRHGDQPRVRALVDEELDIGANSTFVRPRFRLSLHLPLLALGPLRAQLLQGSTRRQPFNATDGRYCYCAAGMRVV